MKDSIRLDEAKLAVAIRELYPEAYKAIESLKAEQQLMAAEPGTKEQIEAREMALRATYADDYQDRNKERNEASHLEEDAYRKLATVDVAQANALGAAERNRLPDGELKDWIRFDEAKFTAASCELNSEADKAKAIESGVEQRMAVEQETKKRTAPRR
ncbi:hypothetical protein XFHB_12935 (plasmid) [Xylella fastidiosa]|uniref:Phage-related protein n=1 Tax=Xylella fastidiosa TaxID=2371 RepID=A0ABC8AH34_XYLFS|nr:hypothetical protein [Xylella fastidiosa]ALR07845.1 hypothetical protein XFHB_12935 [Xylella fastidiosa]